jgi:hypothetical protein
VVPSATFLRRAMTSLAGIAAQDQRQGVKLRDGEEKGRCRG